MPEITLLDQETIDKIAAGEVVERPSSVVKELVENAIDAKATAITVEIKEGGISFIRITDNGCGIERRQVPLAFLRHSTSKIKSVEDLLSIHSLGFRGEALSSIAAVAQVELITKTYEELTGTRYVIEGSKEKENEEIGAPDGTTFIVRNLFYNTPARRKFLKTAQTEAGYISDLMERMALSHPDISFKFINNGQTKLHTSGNSREKDLIYHIYGRDITSAILPLSAETELFTVKGFIGKPIVSRGNRNYENYFINGRYIKSALISKAIEEGYKGFMMQHQYPFCVLYFTMNSELLDVNVHPTKMELRFSQNEVIYKSLYEIIRNTLTHKDFIPEVPVKEEKTAAKTVPEVKKTPEPFEVRRLNDIRKAVSMDSPYERKYPERERVTGLPFPKQDMKKEKNPHLEQDIRKEDSFTGDVKDSGRKAADDLFARLSGKRTGEVTVAEDKQISDGNKADMEENDLYQQSMQKPEKIHEETTAYGQSTASEHIPVHTLSSEPEHAADQQNAVIYEQQNLADMDSHFLTKDARKKHQIIGQLFDTYWLVQYEDKLFIIDQHAAHEKVLYEKTMKKIKNQSFASQSLSPPVILTLSNEEVEMLQKYKEQILAFGYEIEPFGGKEYAITAIPADFTDVDMKLMFIEMLDDFVGITETGAPDMIMEKVASMSCKAAVKGNDRLSRTEAETLIDELLELENPYNCPHGRPTIISMTKYEIEKKFKRIV